MIRPTNVEALDGHRIWIRYSDGAEGEVDLSDLSGRGLFAAWDDEELFRSVRLDDAGAITWGDEIELCPDAVYVRLTGVGVLEQLQASDEPSADIHIGNRVTAGCDPRGDSLDRVIR